MGWEECKLFYFIAWGLVVGVICMFGLPANCMSLVAFQRDRRVPATTLLQCLAVSDFMLLLTVFVTDSVPYICDFTEICANPWNTWPYIRYIWIFVPISHMCSVWFVVLISLNRFWAVCRATEMVQVWTNMLTGIYVGVVFVSVVAFNMPRFFEYEIKNINGTLTEVKTDFGTTSSYRVYKTYLTTTMLIFIPIPLLIVFTVLILVRLKKSARVRNDTSRQAGATAPAAASTKKPAKPRGPPEITTILVTVVIVTIICQSPLGVFHFVRYNGSNYCGNVIFYLNNISKMLVNVNASINFFIYCVASRKFRTLLLKSCGCDKSDLRGTFTAGSPKHEVGTALPPHLKKELAPTEVTNTNGNNSSVCIDPTELTPVAD